MIIRIKNLRLRTIVGINAWERDHPQDVIVNVEFEFDGAKAADSDDLADTVDYKSMKKKIIDLVENSQFNLLEKLASSIKDIVMEQPLVQRVRIEVDKPHALRFADSVSVECNAEGGE